MKIYEVQRYGKTLEWTLNLRSAEEAFKLAGTGGTTLYQIIGTSKIPLKVK